MKDIILSGIQASGKGTQSRLLLEHFGNQLKYFETGGILRSLQCSDNSIGNYLKELTKKGLLVNDEVVSGLFGVFMATLEENDFILGDGCLRKIGQTQQIIEKLRAKKRDFIVINFEITEDEVYKRLSSRKICEKCGKSFSSTLDGDFAMCNLCGWTLIRRNDDENLESIKNRITAFNQDTLPCIEWLRKEGVLVDIDAMKDPQTIFQEILHLVGSN